ncbi:DNA pilot protein [Microvirus D_HF38_28]|nr:DNA pilot protein [Microvirus D_HF38_28]
MEQKENNGVGAAIAGGLVSGGLNLVGGAINSIFGARAQRKENARNRAHQELMLKRQQDYNDKVNQENREWTNEVNVRNRIESAGYNPYLYDNNAQASAVSSNSAGSAPVENMPSGFDPSFGNALQNVGNLFADSMNKIKDFERNNYDLGRKQLIDAKKDELSGGEGYTEAQEAVGNAKLAGAHARKELALAAQEELNTTFMQSQAYDENSQPMTNPDGSPMTYSDVKNKGIALQQYKTIEKLSQEIANLVEQGDGIKWDNLIKKYNLEKLMPETLNQIRALTDKYNTEVKKLNSDIRLNAELALTEYFKRMNYQATANMNLSLSNFYRTSAWDMIQLNPYKKRELESRANYNNTSAWDIQRTNPYKIAGLISDFNLKNGQLDRLNYDLNYDKAHEWQRNLMNYFNLYSNNPFLNNVRALGGAFGTLLKL